jgi:hypothetical protein
MDDPSVHGYKIRSFPHERGNWATFVYLPGNHFKNVDIVPTYFLKKQIFSANN